MQRAAPSAEPAVPSTPAQHGRRDRILETATVILNAGGEDALQMKELAQRADVSLATLYRYFPAKDHVLLAITLVVNVIGTLILQRANRELKGLR